MTNFFQDASRRYGAWHKIGKKNMMSEGWSNNFHNHRHFYHHSPYIKKEEEGDDEAIRGEMH